MDCKDASLRSRGAGSVLVGRARRVVGGVIVTLALLAAPVFATAAPAVADGSSYCPSFCGAQGSPAGGWQTGFNQGGAEGYGADFPGFRFGFFFRHFQHPSCPGTEGPVAESGQVGGSGSGATAVNEGGEGSQPPTCEVVGE